MVEHLTHLSIIEPEVNLVDSKHASNTQVDQQGGVVSMSLGVERIISELVSVRLIMSVGLIHDQVGVDVRGEDLLVMEHGQSIQMVEGVVNCVSLIACSRKPIQHHKLLIGFL